MKEKRISFLFIIFTITVLLTACDAASDNTSDAPRTYTHFCFDTVFQLTFYSSYQEGEQNIADTAFQMCDKYDQLFNKYNKESELYRINSHPLTGAKVSEETFELISDSRYYAGLTDGAFDITISPVTDLWDINKNPHVPKKSKINKALKYVNYQDIILKNNRVKLSYPTQSIDLGGIAKGYVADQLKDFFESKQISSAIINLGGNILTIGNNQGEDFKIGIKKPFAQKDDEYSATIHIRDKSVVTSGIYERYFEENNKIYHHILDPETGYPVENNLYSVTIISDRSEEGDALSTATFVMGLEKGLSFINQSEGIEAVFITKDYKLHLSDGLTINDKQEIHITSE